MALKLDDYDAGRRLTVSFAPSPSPEHEATPESLNLELEILRAFKPFTVSVVCQVRVHGHPPSSLPPELPQICIVKLLDRRYERNTRSFEDKGRPYSIEKESAYQRYVLGGGDENEEERKGGPGECGRQNDAAGMEANIERGMRWSWDKELAAYRAMKDVQGTHIPTLYGTVEYNSLLVTSLDTSEASPIRYQVRGFLLEYIPSATLLRVLEAAMAMEPPPYERISIICDQAVAAMDQIVECSVLNWDYKLDNILVTGDASNVDDPVDEYLTSSPASSLRCIGIDFACTRLRYSDETDEQWRRAKQRKDERGAIGLVARRKLELLAKAKGGPSDESRLWVYAHSARWYRELSKAEVEAMEEDSEVGMYQSQYD